MKTAIIYHSRYGVCKQYAIWISEQKKADIFNIDHINLDVMQDYDNFIILTGVLYNRITILSKLKKYKMQFENKNVKFILCSIDDTLDKFTFPLQAFFKNSLLQLGTIPGYLSLDTLSKWDNIQLLVTKYLNPKSSFLSNLKEMQCPKRSNLDSLLTQLDK